jgi:hypothetical protein
MMALSATTIVVPIFTLFDDACMLSRFDDACMLSRFKDD